MYTYIEGERGKGKQRRGKDNFSFLNTYRIKCWAFYRELENFKFIAIRYDTIRYANKEETLRSAGMNEVYGSLARDIQHRELETKFKSMPVEYNVHSLRPIKVPKRYVVRALIYGNKTNNDLLPSICYGNASKIENLSLAVNYYTLVGVLFRVYDVLGTYT